MSRGRGRAGSAATAKVYVPGAVDAEPRDRRPWRHPAFGVLAVSALIGSADQHRWPGRIQKAAGQTSWLHGPDHTRPALTGLPEQGEIPNFPESNTPRRRQVGGAGRVAAGLLLRGHATAGLLRRAAGAGATREAVP